MVKRRIDWESAGRRNRMSGWCALAAAGALAGVSSGTASGQCQYEVVGIVQAPPCPFVGPPDTFVAGMSSDGRVAGSYNICGTAWDEAFVWTPNPPPGSGGTFKTLPRPDGVLSARGADVNAHGFVIGGHLVSGKGWKGFIYDPQTEQFTYLDPLHPDIWPQTASTANAINDNNIIVGSRMISAPGEPEVSNAVIWHPFGIDGVGPAVVIDLGIAELGPNNRAHRISETGQSVLGATGPANNPIGFVYEPPDMPFLLNEEFGMSSSTAFGIIADGHYAGTGAFINTGLVRAFVLKEAKITALIDPLPGWTHSATRDANALGQVLIRSQVPGDKPGIWQNGVHTALEDLMEPVPNLVLTLPQSINNAGQIVTRGALAGKTVGILLSPIDRPLTDLNGDCVTDVYDLLILLGSWGRCNSDHCPADFTGNGSVGVPDLLILLSNWG